MSDKQHTNWIHHTVLLKCVFLLTMLQPCSSVRLYTETNEILAKFEPQQRGIKGVDTQIDFFVTGGDQLSHVTHTESVLRAFAMGTMLYHQTHRVTCVFPNTSSCYQVDGTIRFSIYYDQLQSQLVVTVLQVEGLLWPSQTCSLQPFVKLRLMWAGSVGVEVDDCTDKEVGLLLSPHAVCQSTNGIIKCIIGQRNYSRQCVFVCDGVVDYCPQGEGTAPILWTVLQEWRTRIVKGSCNPLFGDQFSCIMQEDKELHHINLKMEVLQ